MQIISHMRHSRNIAEPERLASVVAGGILAVNGLQNRSVRGLVMVLIGGDLLRRGLTGHSFLYEAFGVRTAPRGQGASTSVPYELGIRVDASIHINRPRAEVFRFWRKLSNLPRFMSQIESVHEIDAKHSHWVVKAPIRGRVEWDAVINNEVENELIAWRSLWGGDVDNAGSVWFLDDPSRSGTVVKIELQYNPPAGIVGGLLASLWGEEPSAQIQSDLARLKQVLESHEDLSTYGEAHQHAERLVDEASEESFPASDAPAW